MEQERALNFPEDIYQLMARYAGQSMDKFETTPPHIQSVVFEEMTTHQICKRYAPGFTKSQARDAVIGGGGGGQSDCVAVFVNGSYLPNSPAGNETLDNTDIESVCFVIMQLAKSNYFDQASMQASASGLKDFLVGQAQANENPRRTNRRRQIQSVLEDLGKVDRLSAIQTEFYYVSLKAEEGQEPAQLKKQVEAFRIGAGKFIKGLVKAEAPPNVEVLSLTRYRELLAANEPGAARKSAQSIAPDTAATPASSQSNLKQTPSVSPPLPANDRAPSPARENLLRGVQLSPMPNAPGIEQGFIGLVQASEFVKILERADGMGPIEDLAAYNVRNFLGADEPVNQHIADTVRGQNADQFAYLNNGVVLVADAAQYKPGELTLRNYHIVNGLQTSMTLYGLRDELASKPRVSVVLKVVVTPDHEMRREISRSSNRQTAIAKLALKTDHFFLRRLAQNFASRRAEDDRFSVHLESGSESLVDGAAENLMSSDDLIRAMGATFLRRPHAAADGAARFSRDVNKNLFQEGQSAAPYILAAYLMQIVDKHLESVVAVDRRYRFHLAYGLMLLAETKSLPTQLSAEWIPRACDEIEKRVATKKVRKAIDLVESAIKKVEANARKRGDAKDLEKRDKAFTQPLTHSIMDRKSAFKW